ncbi:MAG: WYL domain-containing protein [Deltaproteobacteria bacterium]|jgi:predicted DNA-binding transcriptional regulator YafY|nr:WYL domain-containing protein [Deltaproteobacteria bacterium]
MPSNDYYPLFQQLLELVIWLQGSHDGVTIGEITERFRVVRRTAERMRNVVKAFFGDSFIEERVGREKKFWLKSGQLDNIAASAFKEDELAALNIAVRLLEKNSLHEGARSLEKLGDKLRMLVKFSDAKKLNLDDLMKSEGLALRCAPRLVYDNGLVRRLREAIMSFRMVKIFYRIPAVGPSWPDSPPDNGDSKGAEVARKEGDRDSKGAEVAGKEGSGAGALGYPEADFEYTVIPLGFLYGDRNHYFVGRLPVDDKPIRHFILTRIKKVEILEDVFEEELDFSLEEHAAKSFGAFQEPPFKVEWLFSPMVAHEAAHFVFHPTQTMKHNPDGSLTVKFVAGGRLEMAWHLYTWGNQVKVIKPKNFWDNLPKLY